MFCKHKYKICAAKVHNLWETATSQMPCKTYTWVLCKCENCGKLKERKLKGTYSVKDLNLGIEDVK